MKLMRSPLSRTRCSVADAVLNGSRRCLIPQVRTSLLLIALIACGGSESGSLPPPPTPSLTLTLSAPALTLPAGDEGLVQVNLTRENLSQVVRLTVSDVPSGVAGTFTNASLPEGSVASTLLLSVSRATRPGVYTAIVTASAQGVNAQAVPLTITITPAPSIQIDAIPDSLTVIAGGSGTVTIDISRTDFSGSVYFEPEGAPSGVIVSFPDSPTTGSLATASIATSSDVLPGVYVFAINGFAEGLPAVNTFVQLTVLPPLVVGFDVRVSPHIITLRQGVVDSTTVFIDRRNYVDEISLSVVGLPDGVVATINPAITTGNAATATFFVSGNTPVGAYPLTVIAAGSGGLTTGADLDLVMEATPALEVSIQPESLTVIAGDSTVATLTLLRTNLPGDVQLSATGLPAGVSLRFDGNPTGDTSVLLTFTADATTVQGTYLITIGVRAPLVDPIDVTFTLSILPPP